ncbi:ketol-acid reductoisomerase [Coccidioides immitis H538.4]|uniref:Ketol-acid reductoisomerase n=1 Tax=Coccidioides immitis H538.4 TaxID=396776 RepID=A0A0J8RQA4_COCIT|nr:ketol-acid reductoisomerase [Coccidioides immitis H538.4]
MASRPAARALRSSFSRNLAASASKASRRTFISATNARPALAAKAAPIAAPFAQQARGIKTIDFAGTKETVYEREDWPREKLLDYFKNDTLALIGYGSQGHGQGLNLRDNGLNVIVGVRKDGASWRGAVQDGWVPGKNLFDVNEAINRGTIVMNLLSDAAQSETWPAIKPLLTKGKTPQLLPPGFTPPPSEDPPQGWWSQRRAGGVIDVSKGSGRDCRSPLHGRTETSNPTYSDDEGGRTGNAKRREAHPLFVFRRSEGGVAS